MTLLSPKMLLQKLVHAQTPLTCFHLHAMLLDWCRLNIGDDQMQILFYKSIL